MTIVRGHAWIWHAPLSGNNHMSLKSRKYPWFLLVPALLFIAVFLLIPLGKTIWYSMTAWYNFSAAKKFIGFDNYVSLFSDDVLLIALRNTGILIIYALAFQIGIALVLAIMMDSVRRGFKIFRTIYFFPVVISATAIGLMFSLIYKYDYGLLNSIMTALGKEKRIWLTAVSAIHCVAIPTVWQHVGFYFIVFLTGIANISDDIYESAVLDGITPVRRAFSLTIPMLKPILTSNIVLVVSQSFRVFDMVYVVTGGGPRHRSELLSSYMYTKAFADYNTGYASAIAIVMIVLGITVTGLLRVSAAKIKGDD